MRLRLLAVAVLGLAVAGCSHPPSTPTPTPPSGGPAADTVLQQKITAVHLDTDAGRVTINGRPDSSTVTVHRTVYNQTGHPIGATTGVTGTTLNLNGCGPRCAVDYLVTVPRGTAVNGSTSAGGVTMSGVVNVDVSSENGDILMSDISAGPITVRSDNGTIHGTGLHSASVRADSANGQIDLTTSTPQNISAHLANGTIRLTVPTAAYRVHATKTNGTIDVGVPNSPTGRYLLDLGVQNGDITVDAA